MIQTYTIYKRTVSVSSPILSASLTFPLYVDGKSRNFANGFIANTNIKGNQKTTTNITT